MVQCSACLVELSRHTTQTRQKKKNTLVTVSNTNGLCKAKKYRLDFPELSSCFQVFVFMDVVFLFFLKKFQLFWSFENWKHEERKCDGKDV